jgi:hypothetical protein
VQPASMCDKLVQAVPILCWVQLVKARHLLSLRMDTSQGLQALQTIQQYGQHLEGVVVSIPKLLLHPRSLK